MDRAPSLPVSAPVFLVGAERSGTTLLRLILDSHPDISFGEEFEYAVDLVGSDGEVPDMDQYRKYLEVNRIFSGSGFVFDAGLSYFELVDGFLRSRQQKKGADHVGATIHFGFSKALKLWPDAKLIHIVRDPRDVSPSNVEMGWAGNVWFGLDKWLEAEDEWAAVKDVLAPGQALTIKFPDLINDHRTTVGSVCDFIGVSYTEEMFSYVDDTDYRRPTPGLAASWQTKLSPKQVRLIEARVGDRLEQLGFEPSGLAPLAVAPRSLAFLKADHRVRKFTKRADLYGWPLTISGFLARATNDENWQRAVQLGINDIEKGRLRKSWSDSDGQRSSR